VSEGLGDNGKPAKIRLSELFREGTDKLIRHKADTRDAAQAGEISKLPVKQQPCPCCTALLDQLNAAVPHFEAGVGNFAVVANTSLANLLAVACDRGWANMRLLSLAGNSFKTQLSCRG
jgi:predicted dithiol-disulfide oxidoreductase (DUF899 family)